MKKILLIDAVHWSDRYAATHPLKNVAAWFARHFPEDSNTELKADSLGDLLGLGLPPCDGIIMSGSPRDAWADDDFTHQAIALIQRIRDECIPFLGVCYGHQLLARAAGAAVNLDPRGLELGNATISLTEAGRRSGLFARCSEPVQVLQSHRDAVLSLPAGTVLLASNEHTPIQAFSIEDRMFGVQFHPETDPDILRFLWEPRRENYRSNSGFDVDRALQQMQPTPNAPQILRNFANSITS